MSNLVLEKDPAKRLAFAFEMPIHSPDITPFVVRATWQEWAELHKHLGQELAKRMRVYPGASTECDDGA